jgi:hypothetical protein
MKDQNETHQLKLILYLASCAGLYKLYDSLSGLDRFLMVAGTLSTATILGLYSYDRFSKMGKENIKRLLQIKTIPAQLLLRSETGVFLGYDTNLKINLFLPDNIRSRHVHLIGATGSGKTESVILNFLKQDVSRGMGSIILDAKGDRSFLETLHATVPPERLKVFDLSSSNSVEYDPLADGSALESAQRLFSSLNWSEEYYKSKALSALQRLFEKHRRINGKNPNLKELDWYLGKSANFTTILADDEYSKKVAEMDFEELSGLRDQIHSLCISHLSKILSPAPGCSIDLSGAASGTVLYFRLQSLLSPQLVSVLGKLLINHLNFLAGTSHRGKGAENKKSEFIPVYLDEFASFACPEFADLISKARSAGYALHFSHQSVGDLAEVSKGFLSQITDNSATKIVMRINDPDTAEFFARSFGTRLYQRVTQRVTNSKEIEGAEIVGEGSQREAHQFRASPDLFKTLPTGMGSVLIAHGDDTDQGASHVFKIKFPKLERKEN